MHPDGTAGRVLGMPGYRYRFLSLVAGALLGMQGPAPALARGSQVSHDAPWNSEHIDHLPPEIREAVIHMCGAASSAGHYFATYLDHSRVIKLHFEHLHCEDRPKFCNGGVCLHQEYVSTCGRYRLIKNYYGRGND
jgi:hypothetical protein